MNDVISYVTDECVNLEKEISVKEGELEELKRQKIEAESVLALHKETEHAIKNEDMYTQLQRVYNVSSDVADTTRIEENKSSLKSYSARLNAQIGKYSKFDSNNHKISEAQTYINSSLTEAKTVLPEISIDTKVAETIQKSESQLDNASLNQDLKIVDTEDLDSQLNNTEVNIDNLPVLDKVEPVDDVFANLDNPFTALYEPSEEDKNITQSETTEEEKENDNSNPFAQLFSEMNKNESAEKEETTNHEDDVTSEEQKDTVEIHPNKLQVVNVEPVRFDSVEEKRDESVRRLAS